MEINTIVEYVLKTLIPFLPGIASKITDGFLEGVGSDLLKTIKEKFNKERSAKSVFAYFLRSPSDKKAQDLFASHLHQFLEDDSLFRSKIENIVSISSFSNAKLNSYGDRNTIGQVASTIIDIRPDQNSTINFVMNLNGVSNAISQLPTFVPPESIPHANKFQYEKFISDIKTIISENKNEIETDIALISELLKPAITIERSEKQPNPSRLLQNVITEIGIHLHHSKIFDNFGIASKTYFNKDIMLPLPELSQEFEKEKNAAYFIRKDKSAFNMPTNNGKRSGFLNMFRNTKKQVELPYAFEIVYKGWNIFIYGKEYHLQFATRDRGGNESSWDLTEKDSVKILLTPDVIAKFLQVLLAFYIRHMRYVTATGDFIRKLDSK